MGNVLERTKQEQVIALGRLGWSLRKERLEEAATSGFAAPQIQAQAA
jgi:hypothetical protein